MTLALITNAVELLGTEFVAAIIGGVLTLIVGLVVTQVTFLRQRSRLKRGQFHGKLIVQSHLLLPGDEGREVLCFTTERIYPDIREIFPNPALEKLFLERASQTTSHNPLIDLSGEVDHAKRDIISFLSESIDTLDGAYLMLVTREVQDAVKRKMNRVFLIEKELLFRFRHWSDAKEFAVEKSFHWPRILNLHHIALMLLDERGELRTKYDHYYGEIVFGKRRALATEVVDWEKHGVEL